jgi:hypothetical protein
MNLANPPAETHPGRLPRLSGLLGLVLVALAIGFAWTWIRDRQRQAVVSVDRASLEVRDGVWYVPNQTQPFCGYVLDHDTAGRLRVRSAVFNGRLHGDSVGWDTNGVPELQETFREGIPEGTRITWYPSGRKRSEGSLVNGLQQGTFRQWDEAGGLSIEAQFVDGKPHGMSRSWHPDGSIKVEALMHRGTIQVRHDYAQGVRWEPAVVAVVSATDNTVQSK